MATETIQLSGLWLYYWYKHSDYIKMLVNNQLNTEKARNINVHRNTLILKKGKYDEELWERLKFLFDENFDASSLKDELPELLDFLQFQRNAGDPPGPVSEEVVDKFLWENEKRRKITDQINRRVQQHEPADERPVIQNYLKAYMEVKYTDIFERFDDTSGTITDLLKYLNDIYNNTHNNKSNRNRFNNYYKNLAANGSYKPPEPNRNRMRSNHKTRKLRR